MTAKARESPTDADGASGGRRRPRRLSGEERARLALLALPTFALALAITMVSTYLSEVARRFTHQTLVIGAIVGGEGLMALWIPLIVAPWSDQLRTRIGGRLPFVLAGGIPAAVAVALIGFVHTLALLAVIASIFFAFYFVAYEPYRAMYPDLVGSDEVAGRAQSTQALSRGLGTGCALLGGGLLLSIARPLPFLVAAIVMASAITAFVVLLLHRRPPRQRQTGGDGPLRLAAHIPRLMSARPALRVYFVANALWEVALSAMKAFVVLYITLGLRYPLPTASLFIGGVALVILVGAGASGKLADRFGRMRVIQWASVAYGIGYLVPAFTTSRVALALAVPFLAVGGGAVMTVAYAILMPLMPDDEHGVLTGLYSLSRGVGVICGPILAGAAIAATGHGPFSSTEGFQATWIVCASAALLSVPFVARLRRIVGDRDESVDP